MNMTDLLERIELNDAIMVGKPVIRGTRLTVEYILNLLEHGASWNEIMDEYPGITDNDIRACYSIKEIKTYWGNDSIDDIYNRVMAWANQQ